MTKIKVSDPFPPSLLWAKTDEGMLLLHFWRMMTLGKGL